MTGLYYTEPEFDPLGARLARTPSTMRETLGATISDPLLRPTELLVQESRIQRADEGPDPFEDLGETSPLPEERPVSPIVAAEDLSKEFAHLGLKFDKPMRRRAAEIMAEGKAREIARHDVIARGPQGVLPTAARLGVSLVGAAIDPLNIVSAFIPVVSQARFAGMVASLGATQARFTRGFIEGVVGNAAVEPIVAGLAMEQQLDYTAVDALVNVGLGGFLGGGLHVGVGAVADRIRVARPETREAALRAAVAQAAEGRRVDVEPVLRAGEEPFDPRGLLDDFGRRAPEAAPFDLGELRGARYADYSEISPRDRVFLEGVLAEVKEGRPGARLFQEVEGQGGTPNVIGQSSSFPAFFQAANREAKAAETEARRIRRRNRRLPAEQQQAVPKTPPQLTSEIVERVGRKLLAREPLDLREGAVAEILFDAARAMREENARQLLDFRRERSDRDIREIAEREALPERDATADFKASERAQEMLDLKRPADPAEQLRKEADDIAHEPIVIAPPAAEAAAAPAGPLLRERVQSTSPPGKVPQPPATNGKARTPNLDAGRPLPLSELETLLAANREVIESAIIRSRQKGGTDIETFEDVVPAVARFLGDVRERPSTESRIGTPEGQALQAEWIETMMTNGGFAKPESPVNLGEIAHDRIIDVVIGPPASGKSTALADPLLKARNAFLIDADEAKKLIPEYDGGIGATAVHEESSLVSKAVLKRALSEGMNIVYPMVGDNAAKSISKIEDFKALGYTVNVHMVDLPIDQALTRAVARFITTRRLLDPNFLSIIDHKPRVTFEQLKDKVNGGYQKVSQDVPFGEPPKWIEGNLRGTELPRALAGVEGTASARADRGLAGRGGKRVAGRTETISSPSGRISVDVQYELVELESLIPSNNADGKINPDFPAYLQPRDRTGPATQEQIADIIANFNPARLGANPVTSDGAPMVSKFGVVESGNVRAMVLERIYRNFPEIGQRYRDFIAGEGYDISVFERPVLIRRRLTEMDRDDLIELTVDSNKSTVQALSIGELAQADAAKITADMLAKARPGTLVSAANEPFVTQFIRDIVPVNERNAMRTRDGGLSQEGVRRIEQALFARAYDDLRLLAALREDPDTNFKAIGNALVDVAPVWARMRAAAKEGVIPEDMDITADLLAAISIIRRARADRMLVSDVVSQVDMFSADPSAAIIRLMFNDDKMKSRASQVKVASALEFYATEAQKAVAGPQLFGDAPAVTPFDILAHALRQREGGLLDIHMQETHALDAVTDRAREYASGIRAAGACLPTAA